ncbi:short-chain dehydrogenase [Rhodococcus sp. ACS1]|uniref:NAD(P)-dependent dehydrogenase, short-chain alcohol dehydrogenase family n=1 Tax=Rhodococcus koreensis TaxID=99653 RepID=A0A1H4TI85_9NOCA|nr:MULTISPECIES: SDR family NAD(P)-dependent oxidoreductase [Rhodococcus]PBC46168.1 short-chain dehydrogenase [Rhodococcus sp. ACS1]SEC55960.1 NAD(P)-dependent dehydrogenase, short-chain alcohol dehydrogenase family [Rhodococcus koreensis]
MSSLHFDERVAIVTGAGNGLGRSHALELARRGARVVVNDLGGSLHGDGQSTDAAQAVVDEITAFGGTAVANRDSVATEEGGRAIVQTALDEFGRLDVLVNNAGILRDKAFHKMDGAMIDAVIDVHLKGTLFVTQPAFRAMREAGYGRIVNTSSASGLFGNFGQANYGAAKAGIAGLTRVLALEGAAYGIVANAIAPIAATRMTAGLLGDLTAHVTPEGVSPVVAFLAHEDCPVSGAVYSVAGGRVAKIFVGETSGAILEELTAEAVRDQLSQIEDQSTYHEPTSLDMATAIIARALS